MVHLTVNEFLRKREKPKENLLDHSEEKTMRFHIKFTQRQSLGKEQTDIS